MPLINSLIMHNCLRWAAALLLLLPLGAIAQDDLMNMLADAPVEETQYAEATFKTVRLVNGHSIEAPYKGELEMMVMHRFGALNGGAYEFWGLDQAQMRLGFEYGISKRLSVGIGRSGGGGQKFYDGAVKLKLLRQSSGKKKMPISAVWLSNMGINALKWTNPDRENLFTSRLSYTHQLMLARKCSEKLSLQLMPTAVHRNLVPTTTDANTVFAMGFGGRYKINGSTSINFEYFPLLNGQQTNAYPSGNATTNYGAIALGCDIETGGHVFQLMLSNTQNMVENLFIPNTRNSVGAGGIHFGFNLMRVFTVVH
jgi:hypothetical protein